MQPSSGAQVPEGPRPLGEVVAPHWLAQVARFEPGAVEWGLVLRAVLAIAVPVAVGLAAGRLDVGVEASIGALCGTFVARSGPYRLRLRRIGYGSVAGAAGFLAGGLAAGYGWLAAAVLVGLAVVSAVVSAVGTNASAAGLMLLVFGVVGAGQAGEWHPVTATAWFVAGAAWSLVLAVAGWPLRATVPERDALAAVYARVAELLEQAGTRAAGPARQRLTAALNEAHDAVLSARSRLARRDAEYRRLFVLLAETTPVVEAAVAVHNARRSPPRALIDGVTGVGAAIRAGTAPPVPAGDSPLAVALRRVAQLACAPQAEPVGRSQRGMREGLAARIDALRPGPDTRRFAGQLALCIGLAELLSRELQLERSYWVALTVALVLKPDLGPVFTRTVQRAAGTVLGVLLGAVVLALDPSGWPLVALMALFAGLLPIGQARNFGLFSAFVTPLVIVQLDLAQAGVWSLVPARLIDTAAGCAIVLVFGYLLWPSSRRPRLDVRIADATDTLTRYTARALGSDSAGRSTLRRHTYRQLSDLRMQAQRVISEPSGAGRRAAVWWPVIIGLDRVTDAVTRVAVDLDGSAERPAPPDVDLLVAVLAEVAAAVREERPPAYRCPTLRSSPPSRLRSTLS